MNRAELVTFTRQRGLAVVATCGPDGAPEAALVGIAATDDAELIFDTSVRSRKYRNLRESPRAAVVIGWDDEVTVQCEGSTDIPTGAERERCMASYVEQYPDGRTRAEDPEIALLRLRPQWVRYSDYRPGSFGVDESYLETQ